MYNMLRRSAVLLLFSLGACVSIPSGPSVMVLPGSGKTFDQFREDDFYCKQYASEQVGGNDTESSRRFQRSRNRRRWHRGWCGGGRGFRGGTGAAIGAGSGLLVGGLMGRVPPELQGMSSSNATIWVISNACTPKVIVSR